MMMIVMRLISHSQVLFPDHHDRGQMMQVQIICVMRGMA